MTTQEEIKAVVARLTDLADYFCFMCADAKLQVSLRKAADLIERLAAEKESTFRYACRLATSLSKKHYSDGPPITLLDELDGVLSQIDNMTTGLERKDKPPSVSAHIKPLEIPEGWKLVPIEPTPEMARCLESNIAECLPASEVHVANWRNAYRAMLNASPSPGGTSDAD